MTFLSGFAIASGIDELDVLLDGGFRDGEVYLLESPRQPELARRALAWLWATQSVSLRHATMLLRTERDVAFGASLRRYVRVVAPRGVEAEVSALLKSCPIFSLEPWASTIAAMSARQHAHPAHIVLVDGVPSYRGASAIEDVRNTSLHGLRVLARTLEVPVVVFDQYPEDKIRSEVNSLVLEGRAGGIGIRNKGAQGRGVTFPLPRDDVQEFAPRHRSVFRDGADLLPDVFLD